MKTDAIHKWESMGVGRAPFSVAGTFELPSKSLAGSNPTAYNNALRRMPCPCGTCRVCGHALTINFIIKDADGKLFPVGSECVNKAGDHGLTTKARVLRLKRDRERRQAKAIEKRESKLQAQRDANGGMTDYEIRELKHEEKRQAEIDAKQPVADFLFPLAARMFAASGTFCESVAEGLNNGDLPKGRGLDIMLDILAKQAGRRNSKAYKVEYESIQGVVIEAQKMAAECRMGA